MDSFREFVATPPQGQAGSTINPVSMRRVNDYINQAILPRMTPQEKARFNLIYNPSSQLIGDFWASMTKNNYNLGQILPTIKRLENDPRVPKIAGYVNQQQNQTPTVPTS